MLSRIIRPQAAYRWLFPQLGAITPTYIESILRGSFYGSHIQSWALFDLMEDTWPRLVKDLNEIKRAVIGLDWKLTPWAEEDVPPTPSAIEKSKLVSNALFKMQPDPIGDENGFSQMLYDILDAFGKGVSVQEILWHTRMAGGLGEIVAPKCTFWVRPDNYAWATDGRIGLNSQVLNDSYNYPKRGDVYAPRAYSPTANLGPNEFTTEFPPDKFIVSIFKAKSGHPLGGALLRSLAWWWCASNFTADWLMNRAQIFGLPFRWATYQSGATADTVDEISAMLRDMGTGGWGAFPEGTTMELISPSNAGANSPQGDLLDRADKNCDLLILGQTLTSEQGDRGSQALGQEHTKVKEEKVMSAGEQAADVINKQLIPAILRLNYGEGGEEESPELTANPHKQEDMLQNAQRDQILIQAGIEMPKKWFYKRHDIPLPSESEEVVGALPEPEPDAADTANKPEPEKEKLSAAESVKPTSAFAKIALRQFATAVSQDLHPIFAQLTAILNIKDPVISQNRLKSWRKNLDKLIADVKSDPAAAHSLEKAIGAALANGLASVPKKRGKRA